jgi:Amt family ammonium transporter
MTKSLEETRLRFSEKLTRLRLRFKEPEWRKYFLTLLAGKAIAMIIMVALILFGVKTLSMIVNGQAAYAQQAASTQPTALTTAVQATDPYVNPINTIWTLLGAFLVFGMQAGFTMLEAGFCRSRETVNVLVECVFDTCLCGILYYAWGYAFMFGAGNGFIGWHNPTANASGSFDNWFFLKNITATTLYGATGVPVLAHWLFQFAFADCASTICSGTMIGRTSFWGDILYSICVSGFIYPIIGHWAWGPDGFLYTMGTAGKFLSSLGMNFHDFAGSTVVHSIGGWIALAGGIILGPRLGRKFKRDGGGPMLPHDLTIAVVGGLILWFGWYGFNPGSTLSAMDIGGIARVAANTTLAACAGGLVAVCIGYAMMKTWDASFITNGFLAGLVAITASCFWVTPFGALCLGAVAGALVIGGAELLEYLRIDDPVGAWPVHGLNGIWGTLSIGFFACGSPAAGSSPIGTAVADATTNPQLLGLFYGGGLTVLKAQCVGSLIVCAATFTVAITMFAVLNVMGILRVRKEGELEGLDIHEHGISAYPEYVISQVYAPHGMPAHSVNALPADATTKMSMPAAATTAMT